MEEITIFLPFCTYLNSCEFEIKIPSNLSTLIKRKISLGRSITASFESLFFDWSRSSDEMPEIFPLFVKTEDYKDDLLYPWTHGNVSNNHNFIMNQLLPEDGSKASGNFNSNYIAKITLNNQCKVVITEKFSFRLQYLSPSNDFCDLNIFNRENLNSFVLYGGLLLENVEE